MEQSQERARGVWRDLTTQVRALTDRVQQIERQVGAKISDAQRGVIYQLVQAWGAAKAAREPQHPRSAAYQACWALVKARFKLSRYEDLPASKYDECIAFIRSSYRALTGQELPVNEQGELGLGGDQ